MKKRKILTILLFIVLIIIQFVQPFNVNASQADYIKWMEFNATAQIMKLCYDYDVKSQNSDCKLSFIELLSYIAMRNGNNFKYDRDSKTVKSLVEKLKSGKTISEVVDGNKYYNYYLQCFQAVLGQFVGKYTLNDGSGEKECYGLKVYHPIAKGYYANEFDDFGTKRNFGYNRPHLGHDLMGNIGTPIIAVEGGIIAEIGWNRFGGWRIGILSQDTKRYYYYAHLRKGHPFAPSLTQGDTVVSGQVIGYMGVTGYSNKKDTNMKCPPHLHMGMQIIFDESQRSGNKEIWIDIYQICKLLSLNKAKVTKVGNDYYSVNLRTAVS